MKRIIFVLLSLFFVSIQDLFSQDSLFYTTGAIEIGEVREMKQSSLTFLKSSLPAGPIYHIDYLELDSVVYEEGYTEVLVKPVEEAELKGFNYYKNTFSVDLLEFIFKNVEIRYERNISEHVDLIFPLYIQFKRENTDNTKIDGSILGVVGRFHFTKSRIIRPFVDLEMDLGNIENNLAYYAFATHAGASIKTRRVKVSLFGGVAYGFQSARGVTNSGIEYRASAQLGVNFGKQ